MMTYLGCSFCSVHRMCTIAHFHFDIAIEDDVELSLCYDDDFHKQSVPFEYIEATKVWVNGKDVYMKFRPYNEDRLFMLEAYKENDDDSSKTN